MNTPTPRTDALAALEQSDKLREKYHGIAVAACGERDQAEDKLERVRGLTAEWRHVLDRYGPNVKTADGEYIDAEIVEELETILSSPNRARRAALDAERDQLRAELADERARLDYVLKNDCAWNDRSEIDQDIKNMSAESKK